MAAWSSSTGWAGSPMTGASTSCGSMRRPVSLPPPGRMSSPTHASGSPAPSQAPDTPGRRTATTTGSRPGETIRSATRLARPCSSATKRAVRSGRRRRCPPAARIRTPCVTGTAIRSTSTSARSWPPSCLLFVPPDQPVKIFRLAIRNTSPRRRHCSVTLYAEWVLGENRSRTAIHVVTGTEPIDGHRPGAQRFPPGVSGTRGLPRSLPRRVSQRHGRSHGVHRTQRIAPLARRARTRAAVEPDGPGARSVRGRSRRDRSGAERRTGRDWPARRRRGHGAGARARRALPRPPARRRSALGRADVLGRDARNGGRAHARSGDGPRPQPLAALSDAGVPRVGAIGVLSVQRRLRIPRSAAGHSGAGHVRAVARRAPTCCAPPRVSSSRETSSTGGTSRAARVFAPDSPTTGCGWCMRPCNTWPRRATTGCSTRRRHS